MKGQAHKIRLVLMTVFAMTALSACGFSPLYKNANDDGGTLAALAQVQVMPIQDRVGQVMRNRLIDLTGSDGNALYQLHINLAESAQGFGIRGDATSSQEQLTVQATYSLTKVGAAANDKPIISGKLTQRISYDVVLSDFATLTQREDSAKRLSLELAEKIHRRLVLHFKSIAGK